MPNRRARRSASSASPRWTARLRSHGSSRHSPTTSSSGHTARSRRPRVRVGVDARRGRDGVADEPARERELDVRAHAVGAAGRRAEAGRQALGEPALHPARRDGDDLGRERVGQRIGQEPAEGLDQSRRRVQLGGCAAWKGEVGLGRRHSDARNSVVHPPVHCHARRAESPCTSRRGCHRARPYARTNSHCGISSAAANALASSSMSRDGAAAGPRRPSSRGRTASAGGRGASPSGRARGRS